INALIKRADDDAATLGRRDRDAPAPIDKNAPAFKTFIADFQKNVLYYVQRLMNAAQLAGDNAKALQFAEKAYASNPDDLNTLLTLAQVLGDSGRAEELAKKAVSQVTALISSPTSAAMPQAQKSELLSSVHSTMGRVYFNQKRYSESQKSYLAAIAAKS